MKSSFKLCYSTGCSNKFRIRSEGFASRASYLCLQKFHFYDKKIPWKNPLEKSLGKISKNQTFLSRFQTCWDTLYNVSRILRTSFPPTHHEMVACGLAPIASHLIWCDLPADKWRRFSINFTTEGPSAIIWTLGDKGRKELPDWLFQILRYSGQAYLDTLNMSCCRLAVSDIDNLCLYLLIL